MFSRTNVVNAAFNETYTYDGLNQLTGFNTTGTTKAWDYDAVGNWDGVTTNGATQARTHNKQNEIGSATGQTTPTYDNAGDQTRDFGNRAYTYDAWGRPRAASTRTYEYDGLGRRIQQTTSGTTVDFYYDDQWRVVEDRSAGVVADQYVWSPVYVDALVLRDRDANGVTSDGLEERLYAAQDANWNVTAVFGTGGGVQERYTYDPYGTRTIYNPTWGTRATSSWAWVYNFQGLRYDPTTDKYHARNRDYDPAEGRWTTEDPTGFAAGDINLYRAFSNNSVVVHDPTGLGDGHHWVPVAVVMDDDVFPFLSKKALYVQAGSVSGPTMDSEGKGHMFGTYGGVKHSEYNDIVKEEICKFIKKEGITKNNKMTDKQMEQFVNKISKGEGSTRANSRKLLAFNTEIMKQAEAYAEKARIKPIATDRASVMRRGQTLVRNSSRYVAIAAVASVASFLTNSAKALDVMAESDHFKEAIRQAQRGNLTGANDALTSVENGDVDGNNLLSDLVNKANLDRRAAFLIKTQIDEYFAQIAQKRNAIDALRE